MMYLTKIRIELIWFHSIFRTNRLVLEQKLWSREGENRMNEIGIKDKNGKAIREGDIYHQGDKNILYVVVKRDSQYIGKQLGSSSYAGIEHFQKQIEVIGNINENPNLITA